MTGRIPLYFMIGALGIGVSIGLLQRKLGSVLLGGSLNLRLALIIYGSGKEYEQRVQTTIISPPPFGFGDVYGAAALGFLVGFPLNIVGLLFTLILAVLGASVAARIAQKSIISMRVRLGFYFFLSTVGIIFSELFWLMP